MKKYNVGDKVGFTFAGAILEGTIFKIDIDQNRYWIKALDGYKYPVREDKIDQIIRK